VLAGLLGGLGALAAFVAWELRRPHPLLDPRLFRLRGFGTGSLSLTVQFFAAFGFFFIVLQYLQYVAGLSPLQAALALLPMPLVLIPLARRAPVIADRFGINRTGALGLTLIAAGLGVISLLEVDLSYGVFLAGLVLFAAGMALSADARDRVAIVSSLARGQAGRGLGGHDMSREVGTRWGSPCSAACCNGPYRAGWRRRRGLPEPRRRTGGGVDTRSRSPRPC
jgi:hypothetical protein